MSDLIDRQQAIDALQEEIDKGIPPFDDVIASIRCGVRLARNIIEDLPSAQPEPKEGYWINGKCNLCGEHAPFWAMASTYHESDYCPNCGAKMKGEQHETD